MKETFKKVTSFVLASAMILSSAALSPIKVSAMRTDGTAPYISTWLVAGPSDKSIVGDDTSGAQRPYDGNWSRLAKVTSNSNWACPWHTHGEGYAIDRILSTFWATNASDGVEEKQMTMTWEEAVRVKFIKLYGAAPVPGDACRGKIVTPDNVNIKMYNSNDTLVEEINIDNIPDGEVPAVYEFESEIQDIKKIIVTPTSADKTNNMAIRDINVYDGKINDVDAGTPPADAAKLTDITATANKTCNENDCAAANAVDGDIATAWKSPTHQGVVFDNSGCLKLVLDTPALVTGLDFTANEDSETKKFDIIYTLFNKKMK